MSGESAVHHFSTKTIRPGERFDYWLHLLNSSMWPVTDWSGISNDFSVELQEAPLGCLVSMRETMIGAPRGRRTRRDVDSSAESSYLLSTSDSAGGWTHNGQDQNQLPGDVVLIGQGEYDSDMMSSGFKSNVLKLPAHWLQSWLP